MFDDLRARELKEEYKSRNIVDEKAFYDIWREDISKDENLMSRALNGGIVSDCFSWVFLSGYQSAISHTFSEVNKDDWASFAVSEDKRGEKPGLSWTNSDGVFVLDGYKTWVAGVGQTRQLVVKAGRGEGALYFCVDRETEGLSFERKEKGFLPEMSEGIACFNDVRLSHEKLVSHGRVHLFGKSEILYIYLSFCGLVIGHSDDETMSEACWRLAKTIGTALQNDDYSEIKNIDHQIQEIRSKGQDSINGVPGWESDQKLIAMYSKGIQRN